MEYLLAAQRAPHRGRVDHHGRGGGCGRHRCRGLAQQGADFAFELTDAGFAGVFAHHQTQHVIGRRHIVCDEAVAFDLARPEIAARDRDLLVDGVAIEGDHLHAIQQRTRDPVSHVRRGNEQHLRQIDLDVQVVIAEGVVLRRVEHFQQRGRRVSPPVGTELVHFVQHDHRVHGAGVAQGTDQAAGQRADVGTPMAADLRFIANAAKRHAHELAPRRSRDRFADGGLAGARRSDQREDGAGPLVIRQAAISAQLAHGQVFGDARLHLVQAGVIRIEHLTGVSRIKTLFRAHGPRHGQQPVEVGANHRRFGVGVAHALEPR